MNTEIDPGNGFLLCDKSDPERTHFWCGKQVSGRWVEKDIQPPHIPMEYCGQLWRKPVSEWVYFRERKPVDGDFPIALYDSNFHLGTCKKDSNGDWHPGWLAWRSIGPLPKPVDEGEKAWITYRDNLKPSDGYMIRDFFLAGYQAGLKKGKG